jgi:tRNA(fMet)-specific endonuclease VapC
LTKYLLDTNHLSAYLGRNPQLKPRIDHCVRMGDRFGVCLPVLCEYRSGIALGRKHQQNLSRLQSALEFLRIWPADRTTAVVYGEVFQELRLVGMMMSQFYLLIATIARQHQLTLLTADRDFQPVSGLKIENWL